MLITFGSKRLINICHCLQLTPESSFLFGRGLSLLFSKFPNIPFPFHCLQLTPESSFLFGIGLSLLFSKFPNIPLPC